MSENKVNLKLENYSDMSEYAESAKVTALKLYEEVKENGQCGWYASEGFDYLLEMANKIDDTSAYYLWTQLGLYLQLMKDVIEKSDSECACNKGSGCCSSK